MSTYVISDIHGKKQKFNDMLEQIGYTADDRMLVIGDVIDRGEESIPLLLQILLDPTMELLMGNHELMMLDYLEQYSRDDGLWFYNGGLTTFEQYIQLNLPMIDFIKHSLMRTKFIKTVVVNDIQFVLVHAGVFADDNGDPFKYQNEYNMIWAREEFYGDNNRINDNQVVVFGHTPTKYLHGEPTVWFGENKIGIDCGAAYGGQLACLRLDDLKVFYV